METLFLTFVGITAMFFLLLAIKNILNSRKICAICLSISLTWIILLLLYFLGIFADKIIIMILMGQTSVGMFYIWEKKVKEKTKIFRLPLLLTFIFVIYSILENFNLNSLYFVLSLWLFFALIYLFKFNKFATKLIECCKKW